MNIKGIEIKINGKGRAEVNLWTKSPRVKWNPVAPVSVGSKRIRPVTHPTQSPFIPIYPPRLRIVKGEEEMAISWRFEDSTKDFKAWDKISALQLGWTGFPSISWL
jgi:hypothetical protein